MKKIKENEDVKRDETESFCMKWTQYEVLVFVQSVEKLSSCESVVTDSSNRINCLILYLYKCTQHWSLKNLFILYYIQNWITHDLKTILVVTVLKILKFFSSCKLLCLLLLDDMENFIGLIHVLTTHDAFRLICSWTYRISFKKIIEKSIYFWSLEFV